MTTTLTGKVALVTGSSRGLGAAIAKRLVYRWGSRGAHLHQFAPESV
jgi:NAD(P)-dependent dehydrogenase (short-subunit alcohol dehydrogenase family)